MEHLFTTIILILLFIGLIIQFIRADKYVIVGRNEKNNYFAVVKQSIHEKWWEQKDIKVFREDEIIKCIKKGSMKVYTYLPEDKTYTSVIINGKNIMTETNRYKSDNISEQPVLLTQEGDFIYEGSSV